MASESWRIGQTIHGDAGGYGAKGRAPEYRIWSTMKDRCSNPRNANYPNYGGRGIKVCDRWLESYVNFLADMGRKPFPDASIERENNDGDYNPSNCKWVHRSEQSAHRRCNKFTEHMLTTVKFLRERGMGKWKIAKQIGIAKSSLSSQMRKHGIV